MALPLIPFVAGAAVGSLVTYLYKDESSKEKIKDTAQKLTDNVKSFVKRDKAEVVDAEVTDTEDAETA